MNNIDLTYLNISLETLKTNNWGGGLEKGRRLGKILRTKNRRGGLFCTQGYE